MSGSQIFATRQTESDVNIVKAIQDAQANGLKVLLWPHVDPTDFTFRGFFQPSDPRPGLLTTRR